MALVVPTALKIIDGLGSRVGIELAHFEISPSSMA